MHLSAAIPGVWPQGHRRIAQDLLTFVANFWPGTGALDRSCTSEAKYTGKDQRDCDIAVILQMKDPDRGNWIIGSFSNDDGDGDVGKKWIYILPSNVETL